MTCFVRIGYGGHCTQITNPWKVNGTKTELENNNMNNMKPLTSDRTLSNLIGQLHEIKEQYGEVFVETQTETYQLAHIVPHRFFSPMEERNLAVFQSVGVPPTETNILRGFKFPFPLSLPIFYGPILAAFIYLENDPKELEIDGISLDEWSKIVEGWQDMALIRAGTQTETLKPYWTSDTTITEGAITDAEGALDDNLSSEYEADIQKILDGEAGNISDSSIDNDGYSTEGEPNELDIDDDDDIDELDAPSDEDEVDPELLAYCRKTLEDDDE
jgi:hypothetical protein